MSKEKQIEEMAKVMANGRFVEPNENQIGLFIGEAETLYNAGYRKQSEWISVDERLPEIPDRVLVYVNASHLSETAIDTDRISDGRWVRWGTLVTHWMPLPEAPKMKGGEE